MKFGKLAQKVGYTRLGVAAVLAVAAVGASRLPSHHMVALDGDQASPIPQVASQVVLGANNLMGSPSANETEAMHADVAEEHLMSGMGVAQNDSASLEQKLRELTSSTAVEIAAAGSNGTSLSVSAVPEPASIGLLGLVLLPGLLSRRRTSN